MKYSMEGSQAVIEALEHSYNELGNKLTQGWPGVVNVLQAEWKGPDEQDYEKTLAERLSGLYVDVYRITKTTMELVEETVNVFIDQQNKNMTSGDGSTTVELLSPFEANMNITLNEEIVKYVPNSFQGERELGVINGESGSTSIKTAVTDFVDGVKAVISTNFEEITVKAENAFSGETLIAVKALLNSVGSSVDTVSTAVKDLFEAVDVRVKQVYQLADQGVSEALNDKKIQLMDTVNTVPTKWDSK